MMCRSKINPQSVAHGPCGKTVNESAIAGNRVYLANYGACFPLNPWNKDP